MKNFFLTPARKIRSRGPELTDARRSPSYIIEQTYMDCIIFTINRNLNSIHVCEEGENLIDWLLYTNENIMSQSFVRFLSDINKRCNYAIVGHFSITICISCS